jgi:carbamoyltransferase
MNCSNKDSGAAILRDDGDGFLKYVAISEERLSRVKFPYFAPVRSLAYCMDALDISDISEIDYFSYDWVGRKRWMDSTPSYRKLENDYIQTKLKIPDHKVLIADSHHLAHAYSVFCTSNFDTAAVLVIDGVGSGFETTSIFHARGDSIDLLEQGKFYGLGQLYTKVTKTLLGFETGQEGKTMGLAPFGADKPGPVLDIRGKYEGCRIDYSHFMDRLPSSQIKQADLKPCPERSRVTEDYYARIAFEVQDEIERAMLHLAEYTKNMTGEKNICITGGVALNCVANSRIEASGIFENCYIFPASSDAGIPFGLALWAYHKMTGNLPRIKFKNAFTARPYPKEEIVKLLDQFQISHRLAENTEVAGLIERGNIVGWFTGGSEYGPRALGHRSILADPRRSEIKGHLNEKVKHREVYRPFAPTVLEEFASDIFDFVGKSPFMLRAPHVRPGWRDKIPAVIHVDNTARVQTVNPENCPNYYDLIQCFYQRTQVPVVLNTSFNDDGEPIVETPLDALICFLRTQIDYLVLENLLIDKEDLLSRQKDLANELVTYRDELLLREYKKAIEKTCRGYDIMEMKAYLLQERNRAIYHSCYRTFDALQSYLENSVKLNLRLAVIADQEHLNYFKQIFPYRQADICLEIATEDNLDSLKKISARDLEGIDSVLIALYNLNGNSMKSLEKHVPNLFLLYEDLSQKITDNYIVPDNNGETNKVEHIEEISHEAIRNKDWDKFFEKLIKADLGAKENDDCII